MVSEIQTAPERQFGNSHGMAGGSFSVICQSETANLGDKMVFYARYGYLVAEFFAVAAFVAGGLGVAFNLSHEVTRVLLFLLWGPMCVIVERNLDTSEKRSRLLWIPMDYWGYGLILLGILEAYLNWDKIARDWASIAL
jgi:hypothetical protein